MKQPSFDITLLLLFGLLLTVQHAESARGCADVDAVTNQGGTRISISGFTVISYDNSWRQTGTIKPLGEWYPEMGYSYKVDAAYKPRADSSSTILFAGNKYFKYDKDGKKVVGPSSLNQIFPKSRYWAAGIDAAALYNNSEFFFKSCKVLVENRFGKTRSLKSKKLGLPCNVDAAYFNGKRLAVVKGKRVYHVAQIGRRFKRVKKVCITNRPGDFPICAC